MPPILVLLLCGAFVLGLLWIERRQDESNTWSTWVPTLWMMGCASKPLATWFGHDGSGGVEAGSPWDRNFAILLMLLGILILSGRKLNWQAISRNHSALIWIYGFALISLVWSEFPFISIKRYIRFSGTLIIALVMLSERNPRLAFESVLRRTAFVLLPFSLVLVKYFPHLGVAYSRWSGELMWVGMADQKNSFGILCFVTSFYLVWRVLRAWPNRKSNAVRLQFYADCMVLLIGVYLLKGPPVGYSATSIIVFLLGGGILVGLLWLRKRQIQLGLSLRIAFVTALFLYGWGTPFGARNIGASFLELLGRDSTFTDRDVIWQELIGVWEQTPILGRGYGGFWVNAIETNVNTPHNGYLGIMLELGIVGVLLVYRFVFDMCRMAWARSLSDFWWGALGFCLLSMVVLHNTSEASFLKTSDFLWSLLVSLSAMLAVSGRKVQASKAKEGEKSEVLLSRAGICAGQGG